MNKLSKLHLALADETHSLKQKDSALGNLGSAYRSLRQYQKTLQYHERHLAIAQQIGDRWGESQTLSNLAEALIKLEQYSDA